MPRETPIYVPGNGLWKLLGIEGEVVWANASIPLLLSPLVLHGLRFSVFPDVGTFITDGGPEPLPRHKLGYIGLKWLVATSAEGRLLVFSGDFEVVRSAQKPPPSSWWI